VTVALVHPATGVTRRHLQRVLVPVEPMVEHQRQQQQQKQVYQEDSSWKEYTFVCQVSFRTWERFLFCFSEVERRSHDDVQILVFTLTGPKMRTLPHFFPFLCFVCLFYIFFLFGWSVARFQRHPKAMAEQGLCDSETTMDWY
jgi:hypothetical protein